MINPVAKVAIAGGILAVLALIHNITDVIFQNHADAMVKHNNYKVRAKHCIIYTLGFMPLMWYLRFTCWELLLGSNILFWSHFFEDTYIPVYLWAKYIRKPPEMAQDPKAGFIKWIQTPLGKILMIWVDQIVHWVFLVPIAYIATNYCI